MTTKAQVWLDEFEAVASKAIPVNDKDVDDAWKKVLELRVQDVSFDKALVDTQRGLVLIGAQGNWHFRSLQCRHDGPGLRVATEILVLLDFGTSECVMGELQNSMHATLYR